MTTLWQDLRYALRMLLKQPGFTLVAVVTLALGIGANTAIFSVVNAVLLRPLGYHEPGRIVTVLHKGQQPVSPANFLDVRAGGRSFEGMAAAEAWGGALTAGDRPEVVGGLRMGEGMFDLLGVAPLLGRTFQRDDYQPGRDRVLVLSHKLWQRMFNGDAGVVGRQLTLSGESYTVVGVMPPEFQFPPFWMTRAEMWAPLELTSRATNRRANSLRVFARLKPDATVEGARAEVGALGEQLAAAYPEANARLSLQVDPLNEKVVGDVRPALLVLAAAVGLVLLIACANVACLLLVRTAARQKETAVRVALGATRWRILRQLLTESLLLSLVGALIGVLFAVWGVDWLASLLAGNSTSFSVRLPRAGEIKIDGAALLFTFTVSVVTGILFGLAPALAASKPNLSHTLKEGGRGGTGGRRRLRQSLVVAELAVALLLLIGAGLLMSSFLKLQAIDPGFDPRNVLALTVSMQGAPQYVGPSREAFYRQLTERLTTVPGVEVVSAINHLPLAGDIWGLRIAIEGRQLPPPGQEARATFRVSRSDYFRAMGVRVAAGRDFTERDAADAPGVVIVNETLARRHWPSEDPLGRRLMLDDPGNAAQPPPWLTVIGVVKDVKQNSWTDATVDEIYLPFQQSRGFYASTGGPFTSMTMIVRTSVKPQSLAATIEETARSLDRVVPVSNVVSLEQVVKDTLWQPRFSLQLTGLLAGVALLLAAVGLYGVMSYSVAERTREVGIRMALGAQRSDVLRLVVGEGLKLAFVGVALGLVAALALTRLMASLLFNVSATDPKTFAAIAVLLISVAALACWIPARRATKVDPMVALRYE